MVFSAGKPSGPAWPKGVEVSESISDSTVRTRPLISVYIITFNEEENIDRALKSVSWADEIIVLDSGSTDRTLEKARELGARTSTHPFHDFVEQKNRALELCSGEWAFNMDADEEVTESLRRSIEAVVNAGFPDGICPVYRVSRRTWYMGRWIHHCGWYPEYRNRLSRQGQAHWAGDTLHEKLTGKNSGPECKLAGDLLHRSYRDLGAHIKAIDRYSGLFAEREFRKGRTTSLFQVFVRPILKFVKMYFLKGGFLDGPPGFIASSMGAWYTFMKYARLYERARVPE